MKKFFITLLILIIIGGVAFFFGWIQLQLPPESYAVISTKTNGIEKNVIKPGEFVWRWQRLIPTNFRKYVFTIQPQEKSINMKGELPSAKIYSNQLQGNPSFSWALQIRLSYTVNPDMLPNLVEEKKIGPENLNSLYEDVTAQVREYLYPLVVGYIERASMRSKIVYDFSSAAEQLKTQLSVKFPAITFTGVTILPLEIPDLGLYAHARNNYSKLLDLQYKIRTQELTRITSSEVIENKKIQILREYGKLFTDYPVLLDYLKMQGNLKDLTSDNFHFEQIPEPLTQ